ncbi:MAG: ImmA/IrrE family metallo-endopeptidase [Peptococcaceae bacterium]|jgi:Zn-dependent peptidase ImmA (M78 family)|nr:ImmA/IrrE family metallo-endopeptidase [Peptococcaceae bacterium]MDH7524464.1 ImmA/IrrE family metallo-endopeptidase [Peptococcaceae bacterium]
MAKKNARREELDRWAERRAMEKRGELGLGIEPISDIFDLAERQEVLLLRYPSDNDKLSAFITQKKGRHVMYINSNMNLGRQIYSTAHELKHLFFDDMTVNSVYICNPGENDTDKEEEITADLFAAHFLMPYDGVRKVFYQKFGRPRLIHEGHVLYLQHRFKVSYAAMLYRMLQCGIITPPIYGKLKKAGLNENAQYLERITAEFGYDTALLKPTQPVIPALLIYSLKENYEKNLVSFAKVEEVLSLWDKKPRDFAINYEYET